MSVTGSSGTGFDGSVITGTITGSDALVYGTDAPNPGITGVDNIVLWNNTTGTLIRDSGQTIASLAIGGAVDHNTLLNLAVGDVHTQYLPIDGSRNMTGSLNMNSNSIIGNTLPGSILTLSSTSNATKGTILFGSASAYSEANDALGLGVSSPGTSSKLQINTSSTTTSGITITGVASQTANYFEIEDNTSTTLLALNSAGNLNVASNKIINLDTPTSDNDAANKLYVDGVAQGLTIKDPVRAATNSSITLSGTQTIDGIALIVGNRVLVKNQGGGVSHVDNGIYVVAAGAWSRSTDADDSSEVNSGLSVFISEGSLNGNTSYVLVTPDPITLGVTPLQFTLFSQASESTKYFNAYHTAEVDPIATTPTWSDVPLDVQTIIDTGIFTHTAGNAEVTVIEGDTYLIMARVTTSISSGTNRSDSQMRIAVNNVGVSGSNAIMYNRTLNLGENSGVVVVPIALSAGDNVRVQVQKTNGGSTLKTLSEGCSLSIMKVRGERGIPGSNGSGSTVNIKSNGGVLVTNTPHSILNFINTIGSDLGGGEVSIENIFGSNYQYAESLALSSTSSGTFQVKLSLVTPSIPAGTYIIHYFYKWALSVNGNNFLGRITTDAAVRVTHTQEPKDPGNDQEHLASGFIQEVFGAAGIHTINIEYRPNNVAHTAFISDARMYIQRAT